MGNDRFERIMEDLKSRRDELNLQMHLARAELRDEWEELEDKFEYAEGKFDQLKEEGAETAHEVREAFDVISEELSEAYKRIKERLTRAS